MVGAVLLRRAGDGKAGGVGVYIASGRPTGQTLSEKALAGIWQKSGNRFPVTDFFI